MAYIGRQNLGGAYRQLDDISSGFDGSDTTHTMQVNSQNVTVGDVNQIILSLGGVIQKPGTDFTVSGSTLTFTTAPAANTSFFAVLLGSDNGGTVTPTDGSVSTGKIVADAITSAKIADDAVTGDHIASSGAFAIGAAGTASSLAGIPFYSADSSIYTHDVSGTDNTAEANAAYGISALDAITTGDSNVAIGAQCATDMNTGNKNTMIGKNAFFNATSAAENVVIGFLAGGAGTATSGYNVIIGNEAAEEVSSMSESTVVGYKAATSNTTGSHILAMGYTAYDGADTENHNLAIGTSALGGLVAGGEYNVAVGNYSLGATTSGDNNTGVGYQALGTHSSGTSNTAVGYQAMSAGNITGNYNTAVGVQASNNATSGQNNTSLGYSAANDAVYSLTNESHRIVIGNNNNTDAYIKIDWTVTSDARDKMNFEDVPHGLDFVNQLTPIKFHFKKSRDDETPHGKARYGFKAQDILALEGDNPVIIDNEKSEHLKYKGEHLVPVLVNAVKELSAKVKALEDA